MKCRRYRSPPVVKMKHRARPLPPPVQTRRPPAEAVSTAECQLRTCERLYRWPRLLEWTRAVHPGAWARSPRTTHSTRGPVSTRASPCCRPGRDGHPLPLYQARTQGPSRCIKASTEGPPLTTDARRDQPTRTRTAWSGTRTCRRGDRRGRIWRQPGTQKLEAV